MAVQHTSTATSPSGTGLIRPGQTYELRQRPVLTFLPLVHTEEVTGSIPVSPTQLTGQLRSRNWPFSILRQQQTAATVM